MTTLDLEPLKDLFENMNERHFLEAIESEYVIFGGN